MDYFLLPVVTAQPTYVRDTADILQRLEGLSFPRNVLLTSIDVVSIYTNIHQTEALDCQCVCKANEQAHHEYMYKCTD